MMEKIKLVQVKDKLFVKKPTKKEIAEAQKLFPKIPEKK